MKAIRIHGRGGPDHLVYEDAPHAHPGPGEVLVRIHATGVIATELQWDETYQTATGSPRTLPIPGRDLSEWSKRLVKVSRGSPLAQRSMPCSATAAMGPRRTTPLPSPMSLLPNHMRSTMCRPPRFRSQR